LGRLAAWTIAERTGTKYNRRRSGLGTGIALCLEPPVGVHRKLDRTDAGSFTLKPNLKVRGMMPMRFDLPSDKKVYETEYGIQVAGDSREVLRLLPDESVDLIVTSPPFALLRQKSYGNEDQAGLCRMVI
jgi:hypothetical protein